MKTTSAISRMIRQYGTVALAAAIALSVPLTPGTLQAQQISEPVETVKTTFAPGDTLFTAFGEEYTASEYNSLIRYSPPNALGRPDIIGFSIYEYNNDKVKESVREYVRQVAALDAAAEYGLSLTPNEEASLEQNRNRILQLVWLEKNGVLDPANVTDELIVKKYDEMKELRYKVQEELRLRHIFMSTYVDYIVEEGDTLESIAEKISGDVSKVDAILEKEPPRRQRNKSVTDDEGNEVPPKALVVGETLMVPMSDDEAAKMAELAQQAFDKLEAGEDFEVVAEEYAENASLGNQVSIKPNLQDKPVLPVFRETFESLEDLEYSEPFRTKHGFQIMRRDSYTPESYRPLDEELKTRLASELEIDLTNEKYYGLLTELLAEYDDFEINTQLLEDVTNEDVADDVIVQVADVKYTAGNYTRDFRDDFDESTSLQERINLLTRLPAVGRELSKWDIERKSVEESDEFKKRAEIVRGGFLMNHYFRYLNEEVYPFEPSEEEIQQRFNDMIDYLKTLPGAEVHQITLTPDGEVEPAEAQAAANELREELAKELENIDSLAKFREVAKRISEDSFADQGGAIGKINTFFEQGFGMNLLKPNLSNSLYGPTLMGNNRVMAFWVGEVDDFEDISIEEARPAVENALRQDHERFVQQEMRDDLDRRSNLEILF